MLDLRAGALLLAAAASSTPLALTQTSTLLVDLDPSPTPPELSPNGEAEVVGTALGRLWLSGRRTPTGHPVFTLDPGETEPEALEFPLLGQPQSPYLELLAVDDLGNGRALLQLGLNGPWIALVGTDGTSGGTFELAVLPFSPVEGLPAVVATPPDAPGVGWFRRRVLGSSQDELFRTDGTPEGTWLVAAGDDLSEPFALGSGVVHVRRVGDLQQVVWRSVSPAEPRVLVSSAGIQSKFEPVEVGGRLLFSWGNALGQPATGRELWATDGTPEGTVLLKDLWPGVPGSVPSLWASNGARAFLSAASPGSGRELWVTDGTAPGTSQVVDFLPGPGSGMFQNPEAAMLGQGVVFAHAADGLGTEPFYSDGTAAGTGRIVDLLPGPGDSRPRDLRTVGDRVFFSARGDQGFDPFSTDGTSVLAAGAVSGPEHEAEPSGFTEFSGRVWFAANVRADDREPMSTSPQGDDLREEPEIGLAPETSSTKFVSFTGAGDRAFLAVQSSTDDSAPFTLLETDGSAAGTREVLSGTEALRTRGSLDRDLLYTSWSEEFGLRLWSTDGTPEGTHHLPLNPAASSDPLLILAHVEQLGPRAYLLAYTDGLGYQAWSTDGSASGTVRLTDFDPDELRVDSGLPARRAGERLFFSVRDGVDPTTLQQTRRLWSVDALTDTVAPLAFGAFADLDLLEHVTLGDRLVALGQRAGRTELWLTDGTPEGTQLLADDFVLPEEAWGSSVLATSEVALWSEVDPVDPDRMRILATTPGGPALELAGAAEFDTILLSAAGPSGAFFLGWKGHEPADLWFTDGTPAGTTPVLLPGGIPWFPGTGPEGFLAHTAETLGTELWGTRGPDFVAELLHDIDAGWGSGGPKSLGRVGDRVLFSAFTQAAGRELHAVSLTAHGGYVAEPFGQGCGTRGFPRLRIAGEARVGRRVVLAVSETAPLAPVAVVLSTELSVAPLGSCTLYLQSAVAFAALQTDVEGTGGAPASIADEPALVGLEVFLQAAAVAIGGPALGALELTNAMEIVLGP